MLRAATPAESPCRERTVVDNYHEETHHLMRLLNSSSRSIIAASTPCPTIRPNEINFLPQPRHTRVQKIRKLIESRGWGTLCMLKYASVRFRGRQMRVAYRPGPSDSPGLEIEWWFADLTDQEVEQLYVTTREEAAILRQIRERLVDKLLNSGT
jgi:hypothetical protein